MKCDVILLNQGNKVLAESIMVHRIHSAEQDVSTPCLFIQALIREYNPIVPVPVCR